MFTGLPLLSPQSPSVAPPPPIFLVCNLTSLPTIPAAYSTIWTPGTDYLRYDIFHCQFCSECFDYNLLSCVSWKFDVLCVCCICHYFQPQITAHQRFSHVSATDPPGTRLQPVVPSSCTTLHQQYQLYYQVSPFVGNPVVSTLQPLQNTSLQGAVDTGNDLP